MTAKKLLTIIGARPQFIKAAAISRLLKFMPGLEETIVHTGQHYGHNMSDVFFDELEMPRPQINLRVGSGSHGEQTGKMLSALDPILQAQRPDWVLVYGDTNSTLAGALSAAKLQLPVAHVEAGLRSFNKAMPEELNRIIADHVSDLLFAPTVTAVVNLQREGIAANKIHEVGDVMYDAALYFGEKAEQRSMVLEELNLAPKSYILATIHRAENTDDFRRLEVIFSALQEMSIQLPIVFPIHPRTKAALQRILKNQKINRQLRIIEPVGYLDMIKLEKNAKLIATDSGGIQKEAFFFQVPCVTLRDQTEWVELIDSGWNHLVRPTSCDTVIRAMQAALLHGVGRAVSPYGDGQCAQKIISVLLR